MRILILLVVCLSGCVSLTFDPNEYGSFISLKLQAQKTSIECGLPETLNNINTLSNMVSEQYEYSLYRSGRTQISIATTEIVKMISSLQQKYKNSKPSVTYCRDKLNNISTGITKIVQTLGKM